MDIERLIEKHKDAVYRQLVRVCGNEEDAEDALAEAFKAAVQVSQQIKDPESFRAWLAKVGSRVCVRKRIRQRLERSISLAQLESTGIELKDTQSGPDKQAEESVLSDCVKQAIDALPEIYREVYLRREVLGEKAEDVARELSLSIPAVKSRLHRARQMARDSLDSGLGCQGIAD